MKKWLSVICVVLLLCTVMAMPTSAAVAPSLRMDGPVQAKTGETVAVALYVQGDLGGAQGTIKYDKTKLDFVSVTLRNDMVNLGNTEDVTVRPDEASGTVRFVALTNVTGGAAPADAWIVLNFTLLSNAAGASTEVSLQDVKASDMSGASVVSVTNKATTITWVDDSVLPMNMEGATIRTSVEKQGIRFEAKKTTLKLDATKIKSVGVLMLPTALLYDGQDLCHDTIGKGNTRPAIASTTDAADIAKIAADSGDSLFATLTNGTTGGRANVAISARAFVEFTDGSIVYYSQNDKDDTAIVNGEASKSVTEVAKKIAATQIANGADPDKLGGLEESTGALSDGDVATLLDFCRDNYAYLLK